MHTPPARGIHPIISFGIVCHRVNAKGQREYLLVQRRDSLFFADFVCGKYDEHDLAYVRRMVAGMTPGEHDTLARRPFADIWRAYASRLEGSHRRLADERAVSSAKYAHLSETGALQRILGDTASRQLEPQWSWPKGRRNRHETPLQCALRETEEESGISADELIMLDRPSFKEEFVGTNGRVYRVWLMRAVIPHAMHPAEWAPTSALQASEVSRVAWCSYEGVLDRLGDQAGRALRDMHAAETRAAPSS